MSKALAVLVIFHRPYGMVDVFQSSLQAVMDTNTFVDINSMRDGNTVMNSNTAGAT